MTSKNAKKTAPKINESSTLSGGSAMAKLDDLPSLGAPRRGGMPDKNNFKPDGSDGFDDFGFDDDDLGEKPDNDSPSKLNDAEKHLKDFYQEEKEGFKMQVPQKNQYGQRRHNQFKVAIDGVEDTGSNNSDDFEDEVEELIEEEINTDRDENTAAKQGLGDGLTHSAGQYGITVS